MPIDNSYGKKNRIGRLKNSKGLFFFLALDHQLSVGRITELDDYGKWLDFINSNDVSGIVLNRGAFRKIGLTKKGVIIQAIGAPSIKGNISKLKTASIEDCIKFDAQAISIQINFEENDFRNQLDLIPDIVSKAHSYNFPTLFMVNLKDKGQFNTQTFIQYTKYCSELGADWIKLPLPNDVVNNQVLLNKFIDSSPPLLLAGGELDDSFFEQVKIASKIGFKGLCIGRNIFKSPIPELVVDKLIEIFTD